MRKFSLVSVILVLFLMASVSFAFTDKDAKELYYASQYADRQLTVSEKEAVAEWEARMFPHNQENGVDHVAGPDAYGYSYIDGAEEGGPEYTWVELTEAATVTGPYGDDVNLGPFELGMTFPFYGVDYTQVYICSNGWITFSADQENAWTNEPIPDASTPNNYIAWFWDDFTPSDTNANDVVYVETVEAGHTVIQYGTPENTFDAQGCGQIHLYENGEIILTWHENTTRGLTSNTVGIENIDGTTGVQACFNGAPVDYPVLGTSGMFYMVTSDASVSGTITDAATSAAIEGAEVNFNGAIAVTDANGNYSFPEMFEGEYAVSVSAEGFFPYSGNVTVATGANTFDFGLNEVPDWQWHNWMEVPSEWQAVAEEATLLTLGDDANSYINFADYGYEGFSWFGEAFTGIYVISNGWASFTHSNTSPYGVPTPSTSTPNGVLSPYGTDLNPSSIGAVYVQSEGDLFTITWLGVPFYGTANVDNINDFQIVINFATGNINFNYNLINHSASTWHNNAIGYEDGTGEIGAQIFYGPTTDLTLTTDTSYLIYVTDPPIADIYGVVSDIITDPIDEALVTLFDDEDNVITTVTTGIDGAYSFYIYEAGTYSVSVMAEGFAMGNSGDIVVTDEDVMYDFTLDYLGQISGTVTNVDEIPINAATVSLLNDIGEVVQSVVTIEDGLYEFLNIVAGTYDLLAEADGFEDYLHEDVMVNDGDQITLDFPMEASSIIGTVSGHVRNLDETPMGIEGVTLTLTTPLGDLVAVTDVHGFFEFVEEGTPIEIAASEYAMALDPVNTGDRFYHHEEVMIEVVEGVNDWNLSLAEILAPTALHYEMAPSGGILSWVAPENYNPPTEDEVEELEAGIQRIREELVVLRSNPDMSEKVEETVKVLNRNVNKLHRYNQMLANNEIDAVDFIAGYVVTVNDEVVGTTPNDDTSIGIEGLTNGEEYTFTVAADYEYAPEELVFSDAVTGRPLPSLLVGYTPTIIDYQWTDIRETGINTGNTGDDPRSGPYALPDGMTYDLFGADYSEFYVNGNGWISPDYNDNTGGYSGSMPSTSVPNNTIAPFWDDMYTRPDQPHGQWYQFFEEDNCFIVQYLLDDRGANTDDLSFEVKVDCETGDFYFSYEAGPWQDVEYFRGIGLENSDGTVASTFPLADITDELTIHWTSNWAGEWAQINGTVTDADGLGIEGANVLATGADGFEFTALTDVDGNYTMLVDRDRADYVMTFSAEGLSNTVVEGVNWVEGEFATTVDAQLFQSGSIAGVVTDGTNTFADVTVGLYDIEHNLITEVVTDVDGNFMFDGLLADTYLLETFVIGYYPAEVAVILDAGQNATQDIMLIAVTVSTIEDIQLTGQEGDYVHCVGIATQATNTTTIERFDAVIQDESGYGLKIFAFGAIAQEDGINRGDEVAVFGYIEEYNGITEIVDFEFTVISTDNELPAPIVQSTLELSGNNAMEGSWAKARGALQQDPDNTGSYTLQVDDGSGSVNVRINDAAGLDFGDLGQDDWVEIYGTIGLYQDVPQIIPSEQTDIAPVILEAPQNFAVELDPDNVTAHCTWGEVTDELIFDEDEPASQWFWETGTMGVRLTPDGPCEVLALKYIINFSDNPDNYEFGARVYDWDETAGTPAEDILYDGIGIGDPGLWVEVDVSEEEMTFDGEFVVAFFGANGYSALANNINYDNDRAWDKSSTGAWDEMDDLYYIRAIVRYIGTDEVVELTPVVVEEPTSNVQNDKVMADFTAATNVVDELDNEYIEEYILYRAFNGGDYEELARTEDQFYDDVLSGLESGTYEYYVTALYDAGESEPSNIAGVDYNTVRENEALPTVFAIESAYPNPFNPSVSVKVAVPQVSNLRAHIYNINGRLVESFAINNAQPGFSTFTWEAKVSSGLYFMQVSSNTGWTQTQKLILLK